MKVSKKKYIWVPVVFFIIFLFGAAVVYVIPTKYEASAVLKEEHASKPKVDTYQLTQAQCLYLVGNYLKLEDDYLEYYFLTLQNSTTLEITEDLNTRITISGKGHLDMKFLVEDLLFIGITWDWYNLTKEFNSEDFKALDSASLQLVEILKKKSDVDYNLEDAEENIERRLAIDVIEEKSTFDEAVERIMAPEKERYKGTKYMDTIDFEGQAIEKLSGYITDHQTTLDRYTSEVEKLEKIEKEHPKVVGLSYANFEVIQPPFADSRPVFPNVKLGLMIAKFVACFFSVLLLLLFLWLDKRKLKRLAE